MSQGNTVVSGQFNIGLPGWGRSFWQDPNDGNIVLLYASGNFEVDYVTSADSGVTWSNPALAFPIDSFDVHNNFDAEMDRAGNVHCVFRYSDSGCYQLLAKDFVSGGWAPSGVGPAGFNRAGDGGSAKGFQGNIMVLDEKVVNKPVADQSNLPHLFIAAKNEEDAIGMFHLHNPFSHTPSGLYGKTSQIPASISGCGPDGGYPHLVDMGPDAAAGKSIKVIFRSQESGHISMGRGFNAWKYRYHAYPSGGATNVAGGHTPEGIELGGYYSRLLFNDSMTFSRCGGERNWLCMIPNKNHIKGRTEFEWDFNQPPWDLLTADFQTFIDSNDAVNLVDSGFNLSDIFVNLRGSRGYQGPPAQTVAGVIPITTSRGIPATGEIPSDNNSLLGASGTPCDISWRDTERQINIYFLNRDSDGSQVISRIFCDVSSCGHTTGVDENDILKFSFSEILAPDSGVRSWAPTSLSQVGGSGNLYAWNSFKALRHPVPQGSGITKKEIVATVGTSRTGIFSLQAWDYDKSITGTSSLVLPSYSADRTIETGVGGQLVSIIANGFGPANAFDQNMTTSTNISAGDTVTLGFDKTYAFSRLEIAWKAPNFGNKRLPAVDIQSSYDGINFTSVGAIPTGISIEPADFSFPQPIYPDRLVKATAEVELAFDDRTISSGSYIKAFMGQYVRLLFSDNISMGNNVPVYQIRLYGPSQTPNKWVTQGFEKDLVTAIGSVASVEKFDGVFEFSSLPPEWTTYGDWNWFVQASGELSKRTRLPTAQPTRLGIVRSGIFMGKTVGNGDGTALTTAEWMPKGTSGVVEVDISIGTGETDEDGNPGRTIKWDTRYHKIGQGVILPPTEEDDGFHFYVAPTGTPASVNAGEVTGFHIQGGCFIGTCDYYTVKKNVPPGDWTLRWMFRRGTTTNAIPIAGDQSLAYIDNVVGLDPVPLTSIFGYMGADSFATGVIHGYLKKANWSYINAYTKSYYWFEPRHGYLFGAPNDSSTVNGYLLGNKEAEMLGYMLGGSGLLSIPSGSIGGYVAVQSGDLKAINGYVLGMRAEQIYGILTGSDSINPASGIFGYMMAPDEAGMIYGGVNLGVSGVATDSIEGFIASKASEEIRGFLLGPPGSQSDIYGYMPPQKAGTILGYLSALAEQTGSINSYVMVADEENDIYGYLSASGIDSLLGPQQRINGYLLNDGVAERINGYMNVIDTSQINGYIKGAEFASGSINVYTSGVGFARDQTLGYLAGISGTDSGNINSYLVGVEGPSQAILGWLVGVPDATDSCDACTPQHGTIPLPEAVKLLALPSSCFNI